MSSYLDWLLEPSSQDKIASCGKHTEITLFSNNHVQLTRFYCHRWDCPNCSRSKRAAISKDIMDISPFWWKIDLKGRTYQSVQKQIKRADAKYVALGAGENMVVYVNKKLPDTEIVAFQKLSDEIEQVLKEPAEGGKRRFKHSRDLFPAKEKVDPITHLKLKVMVNEPVRKLAERFTSKGYVSNAGYYIDLGENAEKVLDKVLGEIKGQVEYQKVFNKDKNEAVE